MARFDNPRGGTLAPTGRGSLFIVGTFSKDAGIGFTLTLFFSIHPRIAVLPTFAAANSVASFP